MSAGPLTQLADVIVPSVFTNYVMKTTTEKSNIITSGIMLNDPGLSGLVAGSGITFNMPRYKDLDNDAERTSTDTPYAGFTGGVADPDPKKITTFQEVAVKFQRNQSWSSSDLVPLLIGNDPMRAIADRVSTYWARRLQITLLAVVSGVFADNDAVPSASEHTRYDLTFDASGSSYVDGLTNFQPASFLDACQTMGDNDGVLSGLIVHSVVFNTMRKNNLIDFIVDSESRITIPTYMGKRVIVDDGVPNSGGVFQSFIFGNGAFIFGSSPPDHATEVDRLPGAGNGGGQDVLYNRVQWSIHPAGYKYAGSTSGGGPTNAATSNNLAHVDSWQRVYPERKMIKLARLLTREY